MIGCASSRYGPIASEERMTSGERPRRPSQGGRPFEAAVSTNEAIVAALPKWDQPPSIELM